MVSLAPGRWKADRLPTSEGIPEWCWSPENANGGSVASRGIDEWGPEERCGSSKVMIPASTP